MRNRTKVMILILLFWIVFEIVLLAIGFPPMPVLIFTILGSAIFNLIGMCLDVHNEKASEWFDSTEFFEK